MYAICKARSQTKPGVDYAGFFGAALHVSGRDREALARAVAPYHGQEGIDGA